MEETTGVANIYIIMIEDTFKPKHSAITISPPFKQPPLHDLFFWNFLHIFYTNDIEGTIHGRFEYNVEMNNAE